MRGLKLGVVLAVGIGRTVAFAAEDTKERGVPSLPGIQQRSGVPSGQVPMLTVEQQIAALQQQVKSLQAQLAVVQSAVQVTQTG